MASPNVNSKDLKGFIFWIPKSRVMCNKVYIHLYTLCALYTHCEHKSGPNSELGAQK